MKNDWNDGQNSCQLNFCQLNNRLIVSAVLVHIQVLYAEILICKKLSSSLLAHTLGEQLKFKWVGTVFNSFNIHYLASITHPCPWSSASHTPQTQGLASTSCGSPTPVLHFLTTLGVRLWEDLEFNYLLCVLCYFGEWILSLWGFLFTVYCHFFPI